MLHAAGEPDGHPLLTAIAHGAGRPRLARRLPSAEELVIEHHPVERKAFDARESGGVADPLLQQLIDRLRHMQSGEVLRIPIVEEEIVVHKRPVVVEEVTLGKRVVQESQTVKETVRREEARIDEHGEARLHQE